MNESKTRDPRMWQKWRSSGALSTHKDMLPNHMAENPLSPYEESFKALQADIMESLRPRSALIIFSSDIKDPPNGYHLSINQKGRWNLGFGREGMKDIEDPVQFPELLKSFALVKLNDSLFGEVTEDMLDHRISVQDYAKRSKEIRLSLERSVEENPIQFATELLRHMEQALAGYRIIPY